MVQLNELKLTYLPKQIDFKHDMFEATIRNSKDIFTACRHLFSDATISLFEEFIILLLNRSNKIIGFSRISSGGVSGTVVDAKMVFMTALKCSPCSSLVLLHNHPSGNLKPSQQDINLTKKLVKAGKLLDIDVIDHLIISTCGFLSFADEGLM